MTPNEIAAELRALADKVDGVSPEQAIPDKLRRYYVNNAFSIAAVEGAFGFPVDPSDVSAYRGGQLTAEQILERMERKAK